VEYTDFVSQKRAARVDAGFNPGELSSGLFDWQAAVVRWALRKGRAAIFADTGLGKTFMQCEWARHVADHADGGVLILAPLAVAKQTQLEAARFGINVEYVREPPRTSRGVWATNYEMAGAFDLASFDGIVLDESSILKSQTGKIRSKLISDCQKIPYRLSCTATPSPNDHMELGNQAEFLGVMSMAEMLAMYFTHDGSSTQNWRLKGHGRARFWEWLATWAAYIRKPSDIGYPDDGYDLPPMNISEHEVKTAKAGDGALFPAPAQTMTERRKAKRDSIAQRVARAAALVNESDEEWIVWCHLNAEQDALESAIIRDCVSVRGADSIEDKESRLSAFAAGRAKILISKPSIAGFGLNLQHTRNMVFVGLDDSFEKFYQAVRRQYRFGQTREVNVHIVTSDGEGAIRANIERKRMQHEEVSAEMAALMGPAMKSEIVGAIHTSTGYDAGQNMEVPSWLNR